MTQSYSDGTVDGRSCVGGLVGTSHGYGGSNIANSYSWSDVHGIDSVGGLVGYNYSDGSTRSASVSRSYSRGHVIATEGGTGVGGLIGQHPGQGRNVYGCFWDIQTSGQATSGGGTGKTTTEMQMASTYLEGGWDFISETANMALDIWWIDEGKDYPRLWWEATTECNSTY